MNFDSRQETYKALFFFLKKAAYLGVRLDIAAIFKYPFLIDNYGMRVEVIDHEHGRIGVGVVRIVPQVRKEGDDPLLTRLIWSVGDGSNSTIYLFSEYDPADYEMKLAPRKEPNE